MKSLCRIILILAFLTPQVCTAQSVFKSKLPAKPTKGATIYGIVECDGKPVEGVQVSDGYTITKTDRKGIYNLKSNKENGQVFITVPGGYEASRADIVPQFWAELTQSVTTPERHDFSLNKVDNKDYSLIVLSDIHFIGKQNDLPTFSKYADKIRTLSDSISKSGKRVYSICLGDVSYDKHWYETGMDIEQTRNILNNEKWPTPLYAIMGNHDSDGAVCAGDSTDFIAARRFMKTYGPRYHSQNFGDVHAVFLDNVCYINTPTTTPSGEGIKGKCNYVDSITPEQLNWLRLDLANVDQATPLIIALHSPIHEYKKAGTKPLAKTGNQSNAELLEIIKPFKSVQIISGHTHKNNIFRAEADKNKLTERNLTSTCGYLWWNTGANNKNLGFDGAPVGFDVYNVSGKDMEFRYIPFEEPANHQFKAWDVNALKDFFTSNYEISVMRRHFPKWGDYTNLPDNSVLLQIWSWDPDGKLEVKENGKPVNVEMIYETNPDLYSTTMLQKSVWSADYRKALSTPKKTRLFLISTSSADSPIEISYTDAYGNVDNRIFSRPAPYTNDLRP